MVYLILLSLLSSARRTLINSVAADGHDDDGDDDGGGGLRLNATQAAALNCCFPQETSWMIAPARLDEMWSTVHSSGRTTVQCPGCDRGGTNQLTIVGAAWRWCQMFYGQRRASGGAREASTTCIVPHR